MLLSRIKDVNYIIDERAGRTLLTEAAGLNNLYLVKYLISHHADVNLSDADGFTPIIISAEKDTLLVVSDTKKCQDTQKKEFIECKNLPILNGKINGYISSDSVEKLCQYDLEKLGFQMVQEKNASANGYLDPENLPDFFKSLYAQIDKNKNWILEQNEIITALRTPAERNTWSKLIAKHPSEWHKSTIASIKELCSQWASIATDENTIPQIEHEKQRMDKLEWMSQINASPNSIGPSVWHFHPVALLSQLKLCQYVNYSVFYCKRGAAYTKSQIVSYSHYLKPITGDSSVHGISRRSGDATKEVQEMVIDKIISLGHEFKLSKEDVCYMLAAAATESGFNPDAAAGTTSASGIGQFIDATASKYGIETDNDRFDIEKSSKAFVQLSMDNLENVKDNGYQGDDIVLMAYKCHHDGSLKAKDYGGLSVAKETVLPKYKLFMRNFEYE